MESQAAGTITRLIVTKQETGYPVRFSPITRSELVMKMIEEIELSDYHAWPD